MAKVDVLFKSHLDYQLEAKMASVSAPEIKLEDIIHINLHHCTFHEFKECMIYAREEYPDFDYNDSILESILPSDFVDEKKYDFVELTEYAKHTAITIGNMTLFSELQKVGAAIESFKETHNDEEEKHLSSVMNFEDYDNYEIKTQPIFMEEIGSCVIGGGNDGAIKITAHLHDSSTPERPIVSIVFYVLNSGLYMTNKDIIDINNIYKANATIIEVFAYLSYKDYLNNKFNHTFDKILISGTFDIDSLEDMYSKHYDLRPFDKLN